MEEALTDGDKQFRRRLWIKRLTDKLEASFVLPDVVRMLTGRYPDGTAGDNRLWQLHLPKGLVPVLKALIRYHQVTANGRWKNPKLFFPDGSLQVSHKKLAKDAKVTLDQLRRALKELEEAGIIIRLCHHLQSKHGGWYSTMSVYLNESRIWAAAERTPLWLKTKFDELRFREKKESAGPELTVPVIDEFICGYLEVKAQREEETPKHPYLKLPPKYKYGKMKKAENEENTNKDRENVNEPLVRINPNSFPSTGVAAPPSPADRAVADQTPGVSFNTTTCGGGANSNPEGEQDQSAISPAPSECVDAHGQPVPAHVLHPKKDKNEYYPILPVDLIEIIRHLLIIGFPEIYLNDRSLGFLIRWFNARGNRKLTLPKLLEWFRFRHFRPDELHAKVDLDHFCYHWPAIALTVKRWRLGTCARDGFNFANIDDVTPSVFFPPLEDSVEKGVLIPGVIPMCLADPFFVHAGRPITLERVCRAESAPEGLTSHILSRFLLAHTHKLGISLVIKLYSHLLLQYLEGNPYIFRELLKREDIPLRDWLPIKNAEAHAEKCWLKFCDVLAQARAVADYWNL